MHFHAHSEYSPLDGYGTPFDMAKKAKAMGHDFLCLTDHGNTFGWLPLFNACKEVGIKPGFGVEGYIRWDGIAGFGLDKDKKKTKEYEDTFAGEIAASSGEGNEGIPHITLVAYNAVGMKNIAALMQQSSEKDNRRRGRPTFSYDQLRDFCEGVIVSSGCPTGIPARLMVDNNLNTDRKYRSERGTDEAIKFLHKIANLKQRGAYPIIEIVAQPGFRPAELAWEVLADYADTQSLPLVLTADSHFVNASDFPAQDLVLRIGSDNPYKEAKKIAIPDYQYLCNSEELLDRADKMGMDAWTAKDALRNALSLNDLIEPLEIKSGAYPKYVLVDKNMSTTAELRSRCTRGVDTPERRERLNHELDVLERKGIVDYFLILSDLADYIHRRGHIVICRGSAGGSLVAYACGISQTDPIPYGLLFERFFDEERTDPPDIDMDFSPTARKLAVEYLQNRYHTSKLLALSMITRKSAIIDAAHMLGIPRNVLEGALSVCNDDLDDIRDIDALPVEITSLYDEFPKLALAEKLIGIPRHPSKNAAGLIVSSAPLPIPLMYDSVGELVSTCDKTHIDSLSLMKADLLSVRALEVIERTIRKIGMSLEELYSIGHDHPRKNDILFHAMNLPAGIFQLDGSVLPALEQIIANADHFDIDLLSELIAASSLCRPSSMKFIGKYAKRQTVGDSILDRTFGVIVYQEQIMELARRSGNLSPNKLRKAVSKSKNTEVEKMVMDAGGLGLSPELLQNLLDAGKYSFNKSHAATYSIVGLWMSYLKFFHPIEFVEAYLNVELSQANPDMALVRRLINEEVVRVNLKHKEFVRVVPYGFTARHDEDYIRYDGMTLQGSLLASGLASRKFIAFNTANTPLRNADLEKANSISMDYTVGIIGCSTIQLLEVFPWVPVHPLDSFPLHYENARFAEGECYLTDVKRLQQTKAMPYPMVGFVMESGAGIIHGKISGKNWKMYKTLLDTPPGTKLYVEFSSVRSRGRISTLECM